MQFNVAQLMRQPTGATRHYQIDEPSGIVDEDLQLVGPIHISVRLLRTQRGVLVTADVQQTVRLQCVRCLTNVERTIPLHIEEEFFPSIDMGTGLPMHYSAEDGVAEEVMIDEHHILDLTEVVRQELLVNLPARVLCKPDCAGLCPICGNDRNVQPCTCEEEQTDPRWAALAALRRNEE
jgi:uncharacterized protein